MFASLPGRITLCQMLLPPPGGLQGFSGVGEWYVLPGCFSLCLPRVWFPDGEGANDGCDHTQFWLGQDAIHQPPPPTLPPQTHQVWMVPSYLLRAAAQHQLLLTLPHLSPVLMPPSFSAMGMSSLMYFLSASCI